MKKLMSVPELKKRLSAVDNKDKDKLLCLLYKNCDMAEKIINLQLLDEDYAEKLVEEYKEKIYERFFPKDIMRAGFSLAWVKSVITEFKKICQIEEYLLDLKLYYVECGTEFTNTFGDIDMKFYNSLCSVYHEVVSAVTSCSDDRLYRKFEDRLRCVAYEADGIGWGFYDYLVEEYYSIPWVKEE